MITVASCTRAPERTETQNFSPLTTDLNEKIKALWNNEHTIYPSTSQNNVGKTASVDLSNIYEIVTKSAENTQTPSLNVHIPFPYSDPNRPVCVINSLVIYNPNYNSTPKPSEKNRCSVILYHLASQGDKPSAQHTPIPSLSIHIPVPYSDPNRSLCPRNNPDHTSIPKLSEKTRFPANFIASQKDQPNVNNSSHEKSNHQATEAQIIQRGKQISFGSITLGYWHFCLLVPFEKRNEYKLFIPPSIHGETKKKWDSDCLAWRRRLHYLDIFDEAKIIIENYTEFAKKCELSPKQTLGKKIGTNLPKKEDGSIDWDQIHIPKEICGLVSVQDLCRIKEEIDTTHQNRLALQKLRPNPNFIAEEKTQSYSPNAIQTRTARQSER